MASDTRSGRRRKSPYRPMRVSSRCFLFGCESGPDELNVSRTRRIFEPWKSSSWASPSVVPVPEYPSKAEEAVSIQELTSSELPEDPQFLLCFVSETVCNQELELAKQTYGGQGLTHIAKAVEEVLSSFKTGLEEMTLSAPCGLGLAEQTLVTAVEEVPELRTRKETLRALQQKYAAEEAEWVRIKEHYQGDDANASVAGKHQQYRCADSATLVVLLRPRLECCARCRRCAHVRTTCACGVVSNPSLDPVCVDAADVCAAEAAVHAAAAAAREEVREGNMAGELQKACVDAHRKLTLQVRLDTDTDSNLPPILYGRHMFVLSPSCRCGPAPDFRGSATGVRADGLVTRGVQVVGAVRRRAAEWVEPPKNLILESNHLVPVVRRVRSTSRPPRTAALSNTQVCFKSN
eukprot:1195048-Prorocentrum_minimum.AAC.3